MNRREFLSFTARTALVGSTLMHPLSRTALAASARSTDIKAICFDAFPVFNPKPILALASNTFPDTPDFAQNWFSKVFAYTWLRTNGAQYKDFHGVIEDALDYTVTHNKLTMKDQERKALLQAWFELELWPDVPEALTHLQNRNIRLSFLSNFSEEMLRTNARNNGVEGMFEYLSTDRTQVFKPHPDAYQLGTGHYKLPKKNIGFCAFAAWDAVGAKWFGYPTIWVNRLGFTPETLQAIPDVTGDSMHVLLDFAALRSIGNNEQ